ncbi:hypothetical protein [Clostridium baratii]|uniref:hypothetical protein n=1 Tax=Clostridium baratii TaxID=1561 RepID=UPI003D7A1D81
MELNTIKAGIDNILNLDEDEFLHGRLLAFSSKKSNGSNKHLLLEYSIVNTKFPKEKVIESVKDLLDYFKNKKLTEDANLLEYLPTNPRDSIDFIRILNHDFSNSEIANGNSPSIVSNSYKVEFLLSCLNRCTVDATSKSDFNKAKYSAFEVHTKNNGSIYIINKACPLYNPRGVVFALEDKANIDKNDSYEFRQIVGPLFKLPIIPHIVVVNDNCYFLSDNVESLFGFEQHNKMISANVLTRIQDSFNINSSSYDLIKKRLDLVKNYNLFADFDENRLNDIINKDHKTLLILQTKLKIQIDEDLNLNFNTNNEADRFIHFITKRAYPSSFDTDDINNPNDYVYAPSFKKIEVL